MVILTTAPISLDTVLTLSLVAALALTVIIAVICKAVSNAKRAKAAAAAPVQIAVVKAVAEETPAVAPGSAGRLKLHSVPPKTAAMLMAIIAEKTGKPLNELRFISIKEVQKP